MANYEEKMRNRIFSSVLSCSVLMNQPRALLLLVTLLLLSGNHTSIEAQKKSVASTAVVDTSIIAVIPYSATFNPFTPHYRPARLGIDEMQTMEKILDKFVGSNKKDLRFDLKRYKRQYVAVYNEKNEKIVWVNFFCSPPSSDWKHQLVIIQDGGDCYFNLKINLKTGKCYDLVVNGVA